MVARVPPSNAPKPGAAPQILRPRRPAAPKHIEKPVKLKTGGEEGEVHEAAKTGGEGQGSTHDAHAHEKLAEIWQPETHSEKQEKAEKKEELHEEEKTEPGATGSESTKSFLKQIKPALNAPPKPPVAQKKGDGFENQQQTANAQKLAETRATVTGSVKAVVPLKQAAPVQGAQPAKPGATQKPPDAFSVLHAAQEPGVYFKPDGQSGAAEQADPELTAAIEEAIRLLFGVRGILRVTGGFNQEQQPAIVIVATQGFGEASMKCVPPKVHKYETILALPYDMLPLKRERL